MLIVIDLLLTEGAAITSTPSQTETGKILFQLLEFTIESQGLQYKDLQTEGVSFLYGYSIAKLQRGIQYIVLLIVGYYMHFRSKKQHMCSAP